MSERVKYEITDGVADVRLVRSEKMNALDDAMFSSLIETGDELARNSDVRAVVLSGEGRAFCAGLDMGNFQRMKESGESGAASGPRRTLSERTHGITNRAQYAVWVWHKMPVPVIAAVHGTAFGGGFQVALGADIRYVAPDTKLSIMEIKWGLVPDMAGIQLMRGLARDDIIRELTYSGRIFSGKEAFEYGFATRVSETPLEDALATAKEIASKNPHAIEASKRMFNDASDRDAAEVLMSESVEQDRLIGSQNQIEAVMSTMEKRPGKYAAAR